MSAAAASGGLAYQVAQTTIREPIAVAASNATVPPNSAPESRGESLRISMPMIQKSTAAAA